MESGGFSLGLLPPGEYELRFESSDQERDVALGRFSLKSGEAHELGRIRLPPRGRAEVSILKKPTSSLDSSAKDDSSSSRLWIRGSTRRKFIALLRVGDVFRSGELEADWYDICTRNADGERVHGTLKIESGETTAAVVDLSVVKKR
jgi:hypothetical protein